MSTARQRLFGGLGCAILLAAFAQTAWLAWLDKSPTFDEPTHLVSAWIQGHAHDFRFDPENLPLWKYYLALGTDANAMTLDRRPDAWSAMLLGIDADGPYAADTLFRTPGNDAMALVRAGRARMIGIALMLGVLIAGWSWRLGGFFGAIIATAAYVLDPNFLAHGALIKNDVPIALLLLALMATVWLMGERVTILRCIALALLPGMALTTKFSGILAIPMLAFALFVRALLPGSWNRFGYPARTRPQRLAIAACLTLGTILTSYLLIWACYGFRFSPGPDPSQIFDASASIELARRNDSFAAHGGPTAVGNATLEEWERQWRPSLAVRTFQWANAHHVLPQSWLLGFLLTYGNSRIRPSFLLDDHGMLGWWYYFPLAMLFKTPLATLVAIVLSCGVAVRLSWNHRYQSRSTQRSRSWPFMMLGIAPVLYMSLAMSSHLDQGLRYVLPVYPFVFIFVGTMAAKALRFWSRLVSTLATLFVVGLAIETYHAYPNFIPFFNVAAGGSRGGLHRLSDSNIDWGQELIDLAQWQRRHADRQLYLCYFGSDDPRYFGVHYIKMPGGFGPPDRDAPSGRLPTYVISAVALQGTFLAPYETEAIAPFKKLEPSEILGGSLYLYDSP